MAPKLEVSAKRVLFFTKVMLTFLVISILIFLNYVDLQETTSNRKFLCLLRDVYTASHKYDLDFEEFELERLRWLSKTSPALQQKHSQCRVAVVDMLNKYGANIGAKEKGSGTNPNIIVLMSNPQTDNIKKDYADEDDPLADVVVVGYGAANAQNFGTVAMGLDSFLHYEPEDKVYLVTFIDTTLLNKQLDSLLKASTITDTVARTSDSATNSRGGTRPVDIGGTGGPETSLSTTSGQPGPSMSLFRQHWTLQGLSLRKDRIYISLRNKKAMDPNSNAQYTQGSIPGMGGFPSHYEMAVSAKCDSVMFPSTLRFAGFDTVAVHELAMNKSKQQELLNLYGSFNLDFIDNLSTEAFAKNNNAISILGFDISRKWFPIAMFLVLLGIYIMLFKTIQKAASSSAKIISGYASDDALDFLIDNKWLRFSIWVLTPAFLLFLVLYSTLIHYNTVVYMGMIAAGVTSLALGWLAYAKSLRL